MPMPANTFADVWKYIKKQGENECWPFFGGKDRRGYGRFSVKDVAYSPHRIVYELTFGISKEEAWKFVQHSCNNPSCCNPKHLSLDTPKRNQDYMVECGRANPRKGEDSPAHILTLQEIADIRQSSLSSYKIGPLYGVAASTIRSIRQGVRWKDSYGKT